MSRPHQSNATSTSSAVKPSPHATIGLGSMKASHPSNVALKNAVLRDEYYEHSANHDSSLPSSSPPSSPSQNDTQSPLPNSPHYTQQYAHDTQQHDAYDPPVHQYSEQQHGGGNEQYNYYVNE